MNAIALSTNRLALSRLIYVERTISRQQELDNTQELSGTFLGHNCELCQDLIGLAGSDIVGAKAISTGIASFGQSAWISTRLGSNIAITDRMPR